METISNETNKKVQNFHSFEDDDVCFKADDDFLVEWDED